MRKDMNSLSQALINASRDVMGQPTERSIVERSDLGESMKGQQYKLDVNKNGKVDAHDFKLLRNKKKIQEALARGVNKANLVQVIAPQLREIHEVVGEIVSYRFGTTTVVVEGRSYNLKKGQFKQVEEELLGELSKATLKSYVNKANSDRKEPIKDIHRQAPELHGMNSDEADSHMDDEGYDKESKDEVRSAFKHLDKRNSGISLAKAKVNKTGSFKGKDNDNWDGGHPRKAKILAKEEVEQIDEVSVDTLKSYNTKASDSAKALRDRGGKRGPLGAEGKAKAAKADTRDSYIAKARAAINAHREKQYDEHEETTQEVLNHMKTSGAHKVLIANGYTKGGENEHLTVYHKAHTELPVVNTYSIAKPHIDGSRHYFGRAKSSTGWQSTDDSLDISKLTRSNLGGNLLSKKHLDHHKLVAEDNFDKHIKAHDAYHEKRAKEMTHHDL